MAAVQRSPWVAVGPVSDRVAHARALRRVHDAFLGGAPAPAGLRAVVQQSWQRSGDAGIDPATHLPPILVDEREISERWRNHPLYPVLPVFRELLSDATTLAGHMLVISDAHGVLLWIEGHRRVIEATENMHFIAGADWSESGAGTNALGTAIAVDHPVQIFSAEHFNRRVHSWQCSGAPIHHPQTGEILGVVDLTGHLKTGHPHTLGLVTAAAGMAEAYLRLECERRDAALREEYLGRVAGTRDATALVRADGSVVMGLPATWLPEGVVPPRGGGEVLHDGRVIAVAESLGEAFVLWKATCGPAVPAQRTVLRLLDTPPRAVVGGRTVALSPRHGEILAVLALAPRGLTAEQLTLELYGERGKPVTVRAELSRLRRLLGPVLAARPYRLVDADVDLLELDELVDRGQVEAALERYGAPLLEQSEVQLVVEARRRLDEGLRRHIMRSGDPALLARWCRTAAGADDLQAGEMLVALLDPDDPAWPGAHARVERLRAR